MMKRFQLVFSIGTLTVLGGFLFISFASAMGEAERKNYVENNYPEYRQDYYSNLYVQSPIYNVTTYNEFRQYMAETIVPIEQNRMIGFGIVGSGFVLIALAFVVGEKTT
jgi:hypothetical protein